MRRVRVSSLVSSLVSWVQSSRGSVMDSVSPRWRKPSPSYLVGRTDDGSKFGRPATHAELWPVAKRFFEDEGGMRAAWLYDAGNGVWEPCFTPRCPESDPAHCNMDNPGRRLRALLVRAAGANPEDAEGGQEDGLRFGATVRMPITPQDLRGACP